MTEKTLSPEQIRNATSNYLRCLNLPPSSQVLIISDKPNDILSNDNLLTRAYLSSLLNRQIKNKGHRVATIKFDNSLSHEEFKSQTFQALKELEETDSEGEVSHTTTIAYIGESWNERFGIYDAADEFGTGKPPGTVRFAGSVGLTTGDCRVLAELNDAKMAKIMEANESYIKFFEEHPQGFFDIVTRTEKSEELYLHLGYDTKQSPFKSSVGKFDQRFVDPREKHTYFNVPSGEIYTIPYPFSEINGKFAAQGLIFHVANGLLNDVSIPENYPLEKLDSSQRLLINLVNGDQSIPMSELGIGFYQMIGIDVYDDASIMTLEKEGPHVGFGHTAGPGTEKKAIDKLADDAGFKSHADFVMDNTAIMWADLHQGENRQPFYPLPSITH